MKRILSVLTVVAAFYTFLFISSCSLESPQEAPSQLDQTQYQKSPGWVKQWEMLKIENGQQWPADFTLRMRQEIKSRSYARSNSSLENVVELGPSNVGGRTRAFHIDHTNPDRFITGSVSGGLWQSMDRGVSWTSVTDDDDNLSVTFVAQDPFNPNVMYYSTGETVGNSAGINGVGLFKSEDGGQTFELLPGSQTNDFFSTWRVVCSKKDSNTVFIATRNGLWITEDAGESFDKIQFNNITDIEVFDDGGIMIGIRTQDAYYSKGKEDGYTFKPMFVPFERSVFERPGRIEITYCDSFPNVVYLAVENTYADVDPPGTRSRLLDIFKSSDRGESWSRLEPRLDSIPLIGGNRRLYTGQSWYDFAIEVHPSDTNIVIFGAASSAYTLDGGISWRAFDHHTNDLTHFQNRGHADRHLFYIPDEDSDILYVLSDGGMHEYKMTGDTIYNFVRNMNRGYNVTQFYAGAFHPTEDIVMSGTQDNGTLRNRDDGDTWDRLRGGDGAYCAINQDDPTIAYQSFQNGSVWRTNTFNSDNPSWQFILNDLDGPDEGEEADEGVYFINPFEMNPHANNELVFFTRERPWMTLDHGGSWFPLTNNMPGVYCIAYDETRVAFLGGRDGLFYRIDDLEYQYPGTETNLSGSLPSSVRTSFLREMVIHPVYDSVLYAAFSTTSTAPRVWKISDALSASPTWTPINGDLPTGLPVNDIEVKHDNPDILIIGTDYGVFTTNNEGENWHFESDIPAVSVHQVRLREDNKAFAFTHGRGAFMADLVNSTISSTKEVFEIDIKVFPNPTSNFIQYNIPDDEELERVEIYSLSGQQMLNQTVSDQYGQGRIDISNFPDGQYVLIQIFESGKKGRTQFVKVK